MDHNLKKVRSTRTTSPSAMYHGQIRPFTSDAVSSDKSRKQTDRPASGSRTRPARDHKPEAAYRHDMKPPTASSNSGSLTDLRKLLHVASELQKVDLEAALNIYKGLMMETENENQIQSEDTFLEQLTAGTDTSGDRTALNKQIDDLCNENENLKKEKAALEAVCQNSKNILDVMKRMETESKQLKSDFKSKEDELKKLKEEKADILAEKNEALTRLSKELGTKLNDNNPAIADLSDPNRALKLGEKYNELYDNEWTDAMETLCRDGVDEERNVKKLLEVLKKCYSLCQDLSEKQMTSLEMVLLNPGAPVTPTKTNYPQQAWGDVNSTMLSKSIYKQLKDCRKEVSQKAVGNIIKEHARANLGWIAQTIPNFVKGCIELCWLMCTQDPPVVLGSEADVGSAFDGNLYKPYTNLGTIVSFNVWPPLLLHKDGPLLVKGIVQPIKVPRAAKSARDQKSRAPDVANRLQINPGKTYISPYAQTQKRTQREPSKQYEQVKLDRNSTSPPKEQYYYGSNTRKNYEEHRLHNAIEDRSPPGNLTVYSSYGSHQGPHETTTQRTYQQDIVRNPSEPYKFEYRGREYVFMNDHTYPIKEYQQIYGTTRGVSEL